MTLPSISILARHRRLVQDGVVALLTEYTDRRLPLSQWLILCEEWWCPLDLDMSKKPKNTAQLWEIQITIFNMSYQMMFYSDDNIKYITWLLIVVMLLLRKTYWWKPFHKTYWWKRVLPVSKTREKRHFKMWWLKDLIPARSPVTQSSKSDRGMVQPR